MTTTDDSNINDKNNVVRSDVSSGLTTTTMTDDVKNSSRTELSSDIYRRRYEDDDDLLDNHNNNNNNNDNNQNEKTTLIRLPSTFSDDDLNDIKTSEQVWKKINDTKDFQSRYRPSELYNRTWIERVVAVTTNDNKDSSSSSSSCSRTTTATFTALQYNMLAEGLCSGPDETPPFTTTPKQQLKKNCYGGFTNVPHPTICLPFTPHRKWRLLESLLSSCGEERQHPDLVALEEIDHYHDFFHPLLTTIFGYDGLFHPKPYAPGVSCGYYSDGCALFWKKDVFSLIASRKGRYHHRSSYVGDLTTPPPPLNQVYIIVTLRHIVTKCEIVVAVTHLKARQGLSNERLRLRQVEELLEVVEEVSEGWREVIIMGDFNSDVMDEGGSLCIPRLLLNEENGLGLSSAYPLNSSLFTTWKTRGTITTRRMIDYIFYSSSKRQQQQQKQLRCTKILKLPTNDEVDQPELLPGFRSPSDHLNIAATFEIDGE